jgi:predicted nuclease of predicted toxin-antitoxin system
MNLSPLTVSELRRSGWDVVRVSELLPGNAPDRAILQLAREQDRVIITQDLDFSTLIALGGDERPSLITLRLSNTDPEVVTHRLRTILRQVEAPLKQGSAVTVEDVNVRVRALPIR